MSPPMTVMDFPGHFDQAHRSVLAACSTHFRALFTVAQGDASMNMIQLDSEVVTAEAFAALVDMMYTSTLMLGESNVMDVLLAASHLHLNTVVKACKHYLTTRTMPMSPPADHRATQHRQQRQPTHADQQRHRQETAAVELAANAKLAANANLAADAATSRLQRSFLLQQLGLSLVSSALGGVEEEDGAGGVSGSGGVSVSGVVEHRASFPIRRFHKRKPSLSFGLSEDRPRQRARPPGPPGGGEEGGLLSHDSRKTAEEAKLDAAITGLAEGVSQDDSQMPSQSDGGHCEGEEQGMAEEVGVGKESLDGGSHHGDGVEVVVKCEPLSSPEPADDLTIQGSDQLRPGEGGGGGGGGGEEEGEKVELSPQSSDRSLSSSDQQLLQPRSQLLLKGGIGGGSGGGFGCSDHLDGKSGFRISSFLSSKVFGGAGSGVDAGDDDLNTTTGEAMAAAHHFLLSPEHSGTTNSASSSMLRPGSATHLNLLGGDGLGGFSTDADSLFLRPLHDGLGNPRGGGGGFPDLFSLDFQRSSLGLHSLARASRGGSLGFPGYRRIAPKNDNMGGGGAGAVLQDSLSSSSLGEGGPLLLNGSGGYESGPPTSSSSSSAPNPHPQLTRASADVLSKFKLTDWSEDDLAI
ncbi:unnamed protein product [Coregonus sp. 'balchen']|nr:unnamed protein product [Coregonus sp. 'balchen']